jgi:hypothetical protein
MTKTLYCTTAAASSLPQVLVLRDSLAAQGETELRVLLTEHPARVAKLRLEFPELTLLGPNQVGCRQWLHLAFAGPEGQLASALKPALIATLLAEGNVVYFDPEIEVFAPLTAIEAALADADMVVTPHVSHPLPADGKTPTMRDILAAGQFNLGFLGVRKSTETAALLSWWQQTLADPAEPNEQSDAFWAAAFASLVPRLHVLRGASHQVAAWNLSQRPLTWDGQGTPQTAEGALVFLNYAGLSPAVPSRYTQNRVEIAPGSALARLLSRYEQRLATYQPAAALPYSFACYTDGAAIPEQHREIFRRLAPANRRSILNPFSERWFLEQIAAASPGLNYPAAEEAIERCAELERRLSSLPHSLFAHAATAMDLALPGSRDRVYRAMQLVSSRYGRTFGQKAGYLKQLLLQRS